MKLRWQNSVLLAAICGVVGLAVALTYYVAAPRIAEKALAEADAARRFLFAQADGFEELPLSADAGLDSVYAAVRDGRVIGYTAQVTVSGSQGMIEIMTGMDLSGRITGLRVGGANFKETPGLGAKTQGEAFTSQFTGLALPAELKRNVDGVTGATISSSAVVSGVNAAGAYMHTLIAQHTS